MTLTLRPATECAYDVVSLGEVMLRLDPGEDRIRTARSFRVWEGGGEYNVARGLRRCFGLRTAIVTALCDNDVGRLVEDLILQGGVDASLIRWLPFDGVGRTVRNGLNFTERGFGVRGALGVSDRGHTAVAGFGPGDVDWDQLFGDARRALPAHRRDLRRAVALDGRRWPRRRCAPRTGTAPSSRTTSTTGPASGRHRRTRRRRSEVNRRLAPLVDIMLGNEEDFTAVLGFAVPDTDAGARSASTPRTSAR